MQRILVTGGAGFIGSHTVDLLLQHDKEVVVLDNLFSGKLTHLDLNHPNLEFVEGDILEYPLLESLLKGCDAVLHMAAVASVPLSIETPIYSLQVNTQGFLHVLEAVRHVNKAMRLVYVSSAAVYGNEEALPCRDDIALSGTLLSPYALQKLHNEDYAKLYARLYGVKSLALRYFNVYGQRQDPQSSYSGVISRFAAAYQAGSPLTLFGDGQQSRDFIHVADVAKANLLALQSDYTGVLNIATGKPETLLSMIRCLEATGTKPALLEFAPERPGDIRSSYAAVKKAKTAIDFESTISLQEGIRQLIKVA